MTIKVYTAAEGHHENGTTGTSGSITTWTGQCLVALISYFGTWSSFTDTYSNTWVDVGAGEYIPTGSYRIREFYCLNATGGANHTFTVTTAAGGYSQFVVKPITGINLALDVLKATTTATATSWPVTTDTETTQNQAIAFSLTGVSSGSTWTQDAAYTLIKKVTNGAQLGLCSAYRLLYDKGIQTATTTGGSATCTHLLTTFVETPATVRAYRVKPPAGAIYRTRKPWTGMTFGHWLFNDTRNDTGGALDVLRQNTLTAQVSGASAYPTLIDSSPIGPGRLIDGTEADPAFFATTRNVNSYFLGAMTAMCIWRNDGTLFGAGDPTVFGCAEAGDDNTFGLFFNIVEHKFTWYNDAGTTEFTSQHGVGDDDTDLRLLIVTRSSGAIGGTLRFYIQNLTLGGPLELDYDGANLAVPDGAAATFSIGASDWTASPEQGSKMGIYEMRLFTGFMSDEMVRDYAADLYAEFRAGTVYATGITVPGAPTIGTATAGSGAATVTFTPPVDDGGSTITGYTATSTPGSITGTGASSPITVVGLTNGTPYTFTVHATNAIGNSAESAASNEVTPTAIDMQGWTGSGWNAMGW